jgi:hypothetical protein
MGTLVGTAICEAPAWPGTHHLSIVYLNLLVSVQTVYYKIGTLVEKLYHLRFFLRFSLFFFSMFLLYLHTHTYSHLILIKFRRMSM